MDRPRKKDNARNEIQGDLQKRYGSQTSNYGS